MFPWGINDSIFINRGTKDAYKAKEMETSFKSLRTAGKSSKMFAELKRYVCKDYPGEDYTRRSSAMGVASLVFINLSPVSFWWF